MNTFTLSLDLDKEQGLPQLVTLRQGDKSGTQLVATIYDHGQLVGGSYTARVSLRHPGSGDTYYRETATYSNGVATVTIDEQYAATVAGVTTGYFELLQGSTVKASTADFIVRILPSAEDGAVPGEVYDSAIRDALDEIDAATGRISQMVVDATEEYLAAHPEITTTVQDNSVTDAKLIQSGGVLDRVGRLWWRLENLLTATPSESESVTVSDAAKTPVAGLTVFGKSTQDGTPTPSAPVPIVSVEGDSEGNISLLARGFNQWDEQWELGSINDTTGATQAATDNIRSKNFISCFPSTAYYCDKLVTGGVYRFYFYDADKNFVGASPAGAPSKNFTTPANARYMKFRTYAAYGTTYNNDICINISDPSRNGTYAPYASTVTPIDLDGHELRSLPDGTRDEVTVDQYGHVTLVERVGSMVLDGSSDEGWRYSSSSSYSDPTNGKYCYYTGSIFDANIMKGVTLFTSSMASHYRFVTLSALQSNKEQGTCTFSAQDTHPAFTTITPYTTLADFTSWLASNPVTVQYALATPVTHDLGTIDPTALVGPDLTAQAVPTAPFALTYERDLNATLARLEAAIADAATA